MPSTHDAVLGDTAWTAHNDTGYELPLPILVRADGQHTTVRYRDPPWLVDKYLLTESRPTVQRLSQLLRHLISQIAIELGQRSRSAVEITS